MSDLPSWLWQNIGKVSTVLGLLGSVVGWICWISSYYLSHWQKELADPRSLKRLLPYLDDSAWRDTYRRTLEQALDTADGFFGPLIGWKAYGVCLTIAFFYPIIFFFISWVLGGPSTLGIVELIPENWSSIFRFIFFVLLAFYSYIVFAIFKYANLISYRMKSLSLGIFNNVVSNLGFQAIVAGLLTGGMVYAITGRPGVAVVTAFFGTFAGIIVVAGAGGRAAILAGVIVVAGTIAAAFATAGTASVVGAVTIAAGAVAFAGAVAGAVTVTIAFVFNLVAAAQGWGSFFEPWVVSLFLFSVALPLLNAALDMASWAVSRKLGREMIDRNFHRWGMMGFAVLDAGLALVFLCALAFVLGAGGEAIDQLALAKTDNAVLNLDAMITQATTDPLGDGLWITLMLFSTLIPTAIHAFVAIGSVVHLRGRAKPREEWREAADQALSENRGLDPHRCRKIAEHWLIDRWLPSAVLVLALVGLGWFVWQWSVLPDTLLWTVEWGRSLVQ